MKRGSHNEHAHGIYILASGRASPATLQHNAHNRDHRPNTSIPHQKQHCYCSHQVPSTSGLPPFRSQQLACAGIGSLRSHRCASNALGCASNGRTAAANRASMAAAVSCVLQSSSVNQLTPLTLRLRVTKLGCEMCSRIVWQFPPQRAQNFAKRLCAVRCRFGIHVGWQSVEQSLRLHPPGKLARQFGGQKLKMARRGHRLRCEP